MDAQSKHSSADDSFHSFLVEHDHFESYVLDPTDFYQQISLSFYGKRSRSFSPRNMHADSDKILERPKTPLKRLRKYPEEIKAINEILNNFSKINEVNNEKKNNFPFFPKINMPQRSPVDNKNDSKSINNIKNNINVRINFFMNGQNKEKDKITNEFQNADKKHKPNGLFYRSKSPESERSKIFINSSKNALQNLNATPLIFKDHKDLNKNGNPFDIKHSGNIFIYLQ